MSGTSLAGRVRRGVAFGLLETHSTQKISTQLSLKSAHECELDNTIRALSYQLKKEIGTNDVWATHESTSKSIIDYVYDHKEHYAGCVTSCVGIEWDLNDNKRWDMWRASILSTKMWGDNICLDGAASLWNVTIMLVSSYNHRKTTTIPRDSEERVQTRNAKRNSDRNITLGHIFEFHYVGTRSCSEKVPRGRTTNTPNCQILII
jgi:hypothetical protein